MKKDNIFGAEGIVIHGDKIVFGMQNSRRWYPLKNGEKAAIIKTLGGSIEKVDKENTRKALIREILEEVKGISEDDIKVSQFPIFTKQIKMQELNPYEQNSELNMKADFYVVHISNDIKLIPNDIPALIEIPMSKFFQMNLSSNSPSYQIKNHIIKKEEITIPENFAIMAPKEIKEFLKSKEKGER